MHAIAARAQPTSSGFVPAARPLHPVTLALGDRPAAVVMQTLVNAAVVQSGQAVPHMETAAALALTREGRCNVRQHHGVPIRLHLDDKQLFVAGYNSLYGPERAQSLLAALDDFNALAPCDKPQALAPHLRAPTPPRLIRQPFATAQALAPLQVPRPAVCLEARDVLAVRLGALGGSAWCYDVLYPALAHRGGQTLSFDSFIAHYVMSIADALDEPGAPEAPWPSAWTDSLLCHALVAEVPTCRAVLAWLTLLDLHATTPRPHPVEPASYEKMAG